MQLERIVSFPIDETNLKKIVGHNLRTLRRDEGLSRKEIAEMLEQVESTMNAIENGYNFPKIPTLVTLSDFYGVSVDEILGLQDSDVKSAISCLESLCDIEKFGNGIYRLTIDEKTAFLSEQNLVDFVDTAKEIALNSDKNFSQAFSSLFSKAEDNLENGVDNLDKVDISVSYSNGVNVAVIAEYNQQNISCEMPNENDGENTAILANKVVPLIVECDSYSVDTRETPAGGVVIVKVDDRSYRGLFSDKSVAKKVAEFIEQIIEMIDNELNEEFDTEE